MKSNGDLWLEREEATRYFLNRFASRDVTISRSGPSIMVGVGDVHESEFMVTREPDGWLVARDGKRVKVRSYEQAAIAIEKDMGWTEGR